MKLPGRFYEGTNIHSDDFVRANTGKIYDISFMLVR